MANYGIPYKGSKSSIAIDILKQLPPAENFYDLFGGGFSITHCAIKNFSDKYSMFHFNEIEPNTVKLIQQAIDGKYNYEVFTPEFITREKFFALKDSDAYIKYIWSFGNDGKTYLYSKSIEPYKKSMHMAVVFKEFDDLATEVLGFSKWPNELSTVKDRRLYLRRLIEHYRKTNVPKVLQQFLNLKQLQQLQQLQRLQHLERLQQLQQLQQLEQLQQLQQLSFSALDYREVSIKQNSIVYCDIPYKGTNKYCTEFSHGEFLDWAATRKFPVYISEYNIEDDRFKCVFMVNKRSKLAPKGKTIIKQEKLYWNGVIAPLL